MRVAQISPLFESVPPRLYGGTERVVHNLTLGLLNAGHEVTVFCSGDSSTPGKIVPVWPEALRLAKSPIADPHVHQILALEQVARRAGEFEVIHNHYDYSLLPLSRIAAAPVVTTLHGRLDLPAEAGHALRCYAHLPFVSISDAQRAPQPSLNWIGTVHHGLDASRFSFQRNPGKYLAFLGRISREKRPDWAIQISRASGIPLRIAAKIDPVDREYYDAVIEPLIDGRHIEYIGEINEREKSDFLGNAMALVFPVDWPEPFGLVMIEAMACGTPVLARPAGSVPEVVEEGVTGFARWDIGELARLVPAAAALDRSSVRARAEERFSIERMTREYLNVYARAKAAGILRPPYFRKCG